MNRRNYIKTVVLGSVLPMSVPCLGVSSLSANFRAKKAVSFASEWHLWPNMKWVGPQYWGNRLQDWELENGRAICVIKGKNRTLHLLTVQNPNGDAPYKLEVTIEILEKAIIKGNDKACFGVRLGAKGNYDDYRSAAVFGEGLDVGLDELGNLQIGEQTHTTNLEDIPTTFTLKIEIQNKDSNTQSMKVSVLDPSSNLVLFSVTDVAIVNEQLAGNFALIAHSDVKNNNDYGSVVGFSNWHINSPSLYSNNNNIFGPICFAQYTLNRQKLKLTAQLSPVEKIKGHKILLQIKKDSGWITLQEKQLLNAGRSVNFAVDNWIYKEAIPYRVRLQLPLSDGLYQYDYEGTIAAEPIQKEAIKAAVFSCNFHYGFPDTDVFENVSKLAPDMCMFLGDQFYEGTGGFGVQYFGDFDKTCLDYLRKWMMFGWSYREIFRHIPCAIIPDDHDVYHGNIWGVEGKQANTVDGYGAKAQDSGGYKMNPEWVNMVQFTQTSHLPDPVDPKPVSNNIGVYFTHWNYGGISFAILEDRKFKSAPAQVLPQEAEVFNGWIMSDTFDIKAYNHLEAELLGKRQEQFLESWVHDWSHGAQMKAVLSQTNFATVATIPKEAKTGSVIPTLYIPEKGEYIKGDKPTVDMDSNGWPVPKRNKAIEILRKGYAFHIAGDQHLATFIQYGLTEFGDSGFAFAGPALNNIWPRRFWPPINSENHTYNKPAYTGNHFDGFGNKMTVKAVANPHNMHKEPAILHNRSVGYGLVTFNKKDRTIKTDCFRRFEDPTQPNAQFPGWPQLIKQEDNFGKKAKGYLPTIAISGLTKPVVQIINEKTNDIVYSLRLPSNTFKAKVFDTATTYTIKVGEPDSHLWQVKRNIQITDKEQLKYYF